MSHPQSDAIKEIVWVGGKTTQSHMLSVHPCSVQPRRRQPESHDILFIPISVIFLFIFHFVIRLVVCFDARALVLALLPSVHPSKQALALDDRAINEGVDTLLSARRQLGCTLSKLVFVGGLFWFLCVFRSNCDKSIESIVVRRFKANIYYLFVCSFHRRT